MQTSLRELTTLGIKNAENLAIPSVRNDVSIICEANLCRTYLPMEGGGNNWFICQFEIGSNSIQAKVSFVRLRQFVT